MYELYFYILFKRSYPVKLAYVRRIARMFVFSDIYSAVSFRLSHGVSAGTYKFMKMRHRRSISLIDVDSFRFVIYWMNATFPFVNQVKYLGIIFDKRITWKCYIEIFKANAFRTYISVYLFLRSEHLSANIKLTLHKSLIISVITCACLGWEFERTPTFWNYSDGKHKVLRTTGKFPERISVCNLHTAFIFLYVYNYIIKFYTQQAKLYRITRMTILVA
jgi:hypothetical protein